MEILVGFILGVMFNPLIMKIIIMFKSKKQSPQKEFGFGYNVSVCKIKE